MIAFTVLPTEASTVCMLFGIQIDDTNVEMAGPQTIRMRIAEWASIRFCAQEQRKYSGGPYSNG